MIKRCGYRPGVVVYAQWDCVYLCVSGKAAYTTKLTIKPHG